MFYALAYVGFIVPAVLAVAALAVSYSVLFGVLGVLALVSLAVVARSRPWQERVVAVTG